MVDQNANAPNPIPQTPHVSGKPNAKDGLSHPSVLKAGETMLIISLVLIFLVCVTVSVHIYLRRRKRRRRAGKGTKKETKKNKSKGQQQPELATEKKDVAELVGTPMCEMGESDPRHEMEDAEVDERHLRAVEEPWPSEKMEGERFESDSDSASERDVEVGISWYDDSEDRVEPDGRQLAMYWSRGL